MARSSSVSFRAGARHHAARVAKRRTGQGCRLSLEPLEARQMMATTPTGHMRVGMNLESVVDWSPAWTFTDVFQASRGWITHGVNTATGQMTWDIGQTNPVAVDSNGTSVHQTGPAEWSAKIAANAITTRQR